jgi:integrase
MATIFKPKGRKKYVIQYFDEHGRRRKMTGATDKTVTQRIARDLENRVALRREGVIDARDDARRDHEARRLAEHLADWQADLLARGNTPKHAVLFSERARRVVNLAKAERLSDLAPARIQAALSALRNQGRSLATCNHHRAAIRAFSRWAWKDGRLRDDVLVGVTGYNSREDRRHDRRTLGMDDLARLIRAAHEGPMYRRMTGPARALCYRLAVASGLRYGEIQSTTPQSFNLGESPSVTVAAGYTKNGQAATLPLTRELADDLAPYLTTIAPEAPAFPLPEGRGADMLKVDLQAAGIPYRDEAGRVFDFHSLRCQLATLADQAGVSPRVVQRLMRHGSLELTGRYTRPRAVDLENAARSLPTLRPVDPSREPATLAATGTDNRTCLNATAPQNATHEAPEDRQPIGLKSVASSHERTFNPLVLGSSPSPVTCDSIRHHPTRSD